jgi:hypothetical protein
MAPEILEREQPRPRHERLVHAQHLIRRMEPQIEAHHAAEIRDRRTGREPLDQRANLRRARAHPPWIFRIVPPPSQEPGMPRWPILPLLNQLDSFSIH